MAVPLIVAGVSAALAVYQTVSGVKEKAKARKLAEEYSRQRPENVYKNLGISTAREEMLMEGSQRREATQVDLLSKLGSRGAAMVGSVAEQARQSEREIAASLDEKKKELDRLIASDEANIRAMQERRDEANIAGIGQLGQTGRQDIVSGISNIAKSAGQFARLFPEAGGGINADSTAPPAQGQYDMNSIFDSGTQNFG